MIIERLVEQVYTAADAVYNELGTGHTEAVYESALEIELGFIYVRRQVPCPIFYKGYIVGNGFIDVLLDEILVVEIKAISKLSIKEETQVKKYLASSRYQRGMLINFGSELEIWEVAKPIKEVYEQTISTEKLHIVLDDSEV